MGRQKYFSFSSCLLSISLRAISESQAGYFTLYETTTEFCLLCVIPDIYSVSQTEISVAPNTNPLSSKFVVTVSIVTETQGNNFLYAQETNSWIQSILWKTLTMYTIIFLKKTYWTVITSLKLNQFKMSLGSCWATVWIASYVSLFIILTISEKFFMQALSIIAWTLVTVELWTTPQIWAKKMWIKQSRRHLKCGVLSPHWFSLASKRELQI